MDPARTMTRMSVADVPGAHQGDSLRVPALVRLPGGRLLLAHDHRPVPRPTDWAGRGGALPDDLPNPNSLWLRTGSGGFWGPPRRLDPGLPGVTGLSDPCLTVGSGGVVHLLASASTGTGLFGARTPTHPAVSGQPPEPGTLRLLHAVSHDGGTTWRWSDITDVCLPSSTWPRGAVVFPASGHGTRLRHGPWAGRLVQPVVAALTPRPDGSRPVRSAALLSDDSGNTWRLGSPLPAVPGTEATSLAGGAATSGTDEHALAELPDGRLVTSARDGAYGGTRWTSWSTDGGQTWGELLHADDLPDPGCNAGLVALDDGRLLLSHASSPRARRAGRLSVSEDGGRTWRAGAALTGPETPFGYSDLAVLPSAGGAAQVLVVAEHPQPDGPTTLTVLMTAPTRPA